MTIQLDGELLDDIPAGYLSRCAGYLSGYVEPDPCPDLRPDMAHVLWGLLRRSTPETPHCRVDVAQPRAPRAKRRARKPNIRKMIAEAEKSGKTVTSITTPDGVTLTFGEPDAGDDAAAAYNTWRKRHARSA